MSKTKDEIEDLIGVRPSSWTFRGDTDSAYVWFEHTPSPNRPRGQPLSWDELSTLNEEYGIVEVESHSHGETGSRLCIFLKSII